MKAGQYSRTALFCAWVRGCHTRDDSPLLIEDSLSLQLIPEEHREGMERGLVEFYHRTHPLLAVLFPDDREALQRILRIVGSPAIILSRARYVEDHLEQAVREGAKQYVLLGAGMDTFGFRRPQPLTQLQVFEVDHPATQEFKLDRIAKLGWPQQPGLHFVPVDFGRENLAGALARSPYDPQARSFFNWLGVTYYLSRDEIFTTLDTVAGIASPGSTIVFDYFDIDARDEEKADKRVFWTIQSSQRSDEPMLTCLDPARLAADLEEVGFRLVEDLGPEDIQQRYFTGRADGYHALKHAHLAVAVRRNKGT